ncbi:hypothetical protein ACFXHA_11465 [Nocardia sp. NPDC059240]|uniref:hypothetical protein n=1 Tax=Nocardia sp. NPDC059240 TaxID=3346786 RepID=UPI0036A54DBF
MRTENINRKFKLHDERRIAAQLPEQLLGLDVVGFGKVEEFPGELLNSFGEFANGSVPPRTRIYRNAQPNLVDAWLLELLRGANIGDRFYLRTGLEYFPWADCRVLDHRWLESLRRVLGTNQGYIAHDKNSAVMTIGAQYEVLGFATGAAPESSAPAEDVTRRIVRAPADLPDHATAVLSGDLRARRLAALSADAPAASAPPVSAPAAHGLVAPAPVAPVAPALEVPPGPALAAPADVLPVPARETPAPQSVDPVAPEPVASPAPEVAAQPQPAPETPAPTAAPVAHSDEAPTQLITRIVVPTEGE